jgi:hypothetical protein
VAESGNDHDGQTADDPADNGRPRRQDPAEAGPAPWHDRLLEALATAHDLADSVEHALVVYSAVSAVETDTALAAVHTTRAVLYLTQLALLSLQKIKR